MATSPMCAVVQHLRRTALGDAAGMTDADALELFVRQHDEAALAVLVRHGPMVWSVCRRLLRSHHDAEDAFQATFLILVRKAATIQHAELVGNWLYGVAHQTAVKARAMAAVRSVRERPAAQAPEPAAMQEPLWDDQKSLLDQELSRLPEKYRVLIVLCDLEGSTRKDVARQLGCPEGTVAGRLVRAREMLARRLARQGLTLSAALLGGVLSAQGASAAVPATVMSSTIQAATLLAAGQAAAGGAISASALALSQGVITAMQFTKLKTVTALLLLFTMMTFTTALLAWGQTRDNVEQPPAKVEKKEARDKKKDPPKEFTNKIGMKFVWIKPGTFLMGTPKDEVADRQFDETQHKVTLTKGFYMGVYPVTQEEWEKVMGNNPSHFKDEKKLPVEMVS